MFRERVGADLMFNSLISIPAHAVKWLAAERQKSPPPQYASMRYLSLRPGPPVVSVVCAAETVQ